ncbi:O-antigen ligase family protein [Blastococcus sp. SYSU DS0617]
MHRLTAVVLRPSTWLALAILSTPLSSAEASDGPAVALSDGVLAVAVVLAGWALLRGGGAVMARSVPGVAFWALGVVSVVAALAAPAFPEGVVGGVRFLQLFCLVPLAVMIGLRTRADAAVVLGSLLGLAFVQGGIGVVQSVTGTGADIGGRSIRAVGTYGAYNIMALAYLVSLALVVCVAFAVVLPGRARWWAAGGAALLAVPLAFSLSRGAWVAATVAVLVVLSRGRPLRLLVTAGAAVAVGLAVLPAVLARGGDVADRLTSLVDAGSEPDQSLTDRFALWTAARDMAFDHPLTGVGPRGFAEHRDAYADLTLLGSSDISLGGTFERVALESPHNFYLLVAGELGLVAAWTFLVAFAVLLARGLVRAARPRSDAGTAVALAGTGLLAYQLVFMVTTDLGGPGSALVAIALGLAGWAAADRGLLPSGRLPAALTRLLPASRSPAPGHGPGPGPRSRASELVGASS